MKPSDVKIGLDVVVKFSLGRGGCSYKYIGKIGKIKQYNKGDNYCYLDIDSDWNGIFLDEIEIAMDKYSFYKNLLRNV